MKTEFQKLRFQFPAEQMEACTISKDFRSALEPAAPFRPDRATIQHISSEPQC